MCDKTHPHAWHDLYEWPWPIEKLRFLGTNSNWTKFSIRICTTRLRGMWVSQFGGFRKCITFCWNCHSQVPDINESCHTCEWVMTHNSGTRTIPVHMCVMTHSYVWHDSFICVTRLIHMRDMPPSYVWRDSFICVTWLIHMWDMTYWYVWHDWLMCVTWLIHICDMTHSYVWDISFIRVTWLIHMCDMTRSHVRHDSFTCVTWLIYTCVMTHSHVWHGSFTRVSWLIHMRCTPHLYLTRYLLYFCTKMQTI